MLLPIKTTPKLNKKQTESFLNRIKKIDKKPGICVEHDFSGLIKKIMKDIGKEKRR